jgi:dimethylargininase
VTPPFRAIVRPPGASFPRALTRLDPPPLVDLALARRQHAGYVAALREVGVEVAELPADDGRPDATFVQDRILVFGDRAVVCPSGIPERAGEEEALIAALPPRLEVVRLTPPAALDGGDVLIAGSDVFVGLSERSNAAAVEQLQALLSPQRSVEAVECPTDLLHLLSGCSSLGDLLLLAVDSVAALPLAARFRIVAVPPEESLGANVLALGKDVLVPAGYPETARRIAAQGRRVHPVEVGEFEKRDGGVTCMSLLF